MRAELALVGGGLANCLIAHRIVSRDPDFPLLVIESGPTLGGHHTWSFQHTDLSPAQRRWVEPLVAHSWDSHELRFPGHHRTLPSPYSSVTSKRMHDVVGASLGDRCLLGRKATAVAPRSVRLEDGTEIQARAVIDGRGDPGGNCLEIGFQKFLGLFVRLENEHGLAGPVLMDATVAQRDGYRFVYTLPFSSRELLIEDTYYSDGAELDRAELQAGIVDYARCRNWSIADIVDEETGVLPIVLDGDIGKFWEQPPQGVARSGMRAALFHPTTGYSLPEAVRLADEIVDRRGAGSDELFELTRRRSVDLWRRTAYFRMLNRMLFRAADPDRRYLVFERFYRLPRGLIERFYAGRLEWKDKLRVLIGKPPVPVYRALRSMWPRGVRSTPTTPEERTP